MSEYSWNKKNNTFTWLSSLYSPFKDALSGLTQYLANESNLEMMKNAFYFTLKAIFVLKMFRFLSSLFGHIEKQLD